MTTILYLIKFSMVRFPSFQFWFIWFGNFDLLDWIENFNLSLSLKSKKFLNEPLNQKKYLLKHSIIESELKERFSAKSSLPFHELQNFSIIESDYTIKVERTQGILQLMEEHLRIISYHKIWKLIHSTKS